VLAPTLDTATGMVTWECRSSGDDARFAPASCR
jgi:hypothetical protein